MFILKVDLARGYSNVKILNPGVTSMDFTIEFSYLPYVINFPPPNSSAIITHYQSNQHQNLRLGFFGFVRGVCFGVVGFFVWLGGFFGQLLLPLNRKTQSSVFTAQ